MYLLLDIEYHIFTFLDSLNSLISVEFITGKNYRNHRVFNEHQRRIKIQNFLRRNVYSTSAEYVPVHLG